MFIRSLFCQTRCVEESLLHLKNAARNYCCMADLLPAVSICMFLMDNLQKKGLIFVLMAKLFKLLKDSFVIAS